METKDNHKEMLPMYREHCLSRQVVHNWVQKFSEGRTSIEDEHRAGRPVEIATQETLQRVEDIIRAERRVTIDAVATAIGAAIRRKRPGLLTKGVLLQHDNARPLSANQTTATLRSFKWEVL